MKNRKICPKCNSTDIIKVPGKAGASGMFAAPAATLRNGSTKKIFPD